MISFDVVANIEFSDNVTANSGNKMLVSLLCHQIEVVTIGLDQLNFCA